MLCAAGVPQGEAPQVGLVVVGPVDAGDGAERSVEEVDDVRAEIEQRTALGPPRRRRVRAAEQGARQPADRPDAVGTRPAGHPGPPGGDLGVVAQRQYQRRGDADRGPGHRAGPVEIGGERLLADQVPARPRRPHREPGLHLRRYRERHGVDGVEQLLERPHRAPAQHAGQLVGDLGPAGPQRRQLSAGVGGHRGPVHPPRPRPAPDQPHAQRSHVRHHAGDIG